MSTKDGVVGNWERYFIFVPEEVEAIESIHVVSADTPKKLVWHYVFKEVEPIQWNLVIIWAYGRSKK